MTILTSQLSAHPKNKVAPVTPALPDTFAQVPAPTDEQVAALKEAAVTFYTLRAQIEDPLLDAIDPDLFTGGDGSLDPASYVARLREIRDAADSKRFFVDISIPGKESPWRIELLSGVVFEARRRLRAMSEDPNV